EHRARSRQQRVYAVHTIGIGDILLIIPDAIEVVLRRDVVVEVRGEEFAIVLARGLEREVFAVVVVVRRDAILQRTRGRRSQLAVAVENVLHHWVDGGRIRPDAARQRGIFGARQVE